MIRVMIVDDEPFIAKGLSMLIDWDKEGFSIVKIASNGLEALDYIRENEVDLIMLDIQMPVMTGLEMLRIIREEHLSDAFAIVLSGYNDFMYTKQAMQYECMDYILKPVQREELLEALRRIYNKRKINSLEEQQRSDMESRYLVQNIKALIQGNFGQKELEYVKNNTGINESVWYIHITFDYISEVAEMSDDESEAQHKVLYDSVKSFLGEENRLCVNDVSGYTEVYEIGFLFSEDLAQERGLTKDDYLRSLLEYISENVKIPVVLLVGKEVEDISKVSKSYSTACALRSIRGFQQKKDIYYYDEEVHVGETNFVLCKKTLDRLLAAVEQNKEDEIDESIDVLLEEIESLGVSDKAVSLNINYLIFQLIHLAMNRDETVNQEEVMQYINDKVTGDGIDQGVFVHMKGFCHEFASYLSQLQVNLSGDILIEIEREIRENYAQNLTLRDLGKKYFINSSYLGQLFRKKYGQSFKDYLCNHRIQIAAEELLKSDKKISQIAEEVGYHDMDYFTNRFILCRGCTPAKYRRSGGVTENL